MAHISRSISTVIKNPVSISGAEKENYLIDFSNIKSSLPNFKTSKTFRHLDPISPLPTSSAEKQHYLRQIDYNFNIKRFNMIYHFTIRTVTKCTTPSSTKINKTHLITTFNPSSASKLIRGRLSGLKTTETNIMLKITSKITKSQLPCQA